jgi:tRNA pseudouridine38-40 synthase
MALPPCPSGHLPTQNWKLTLAYDGSSFAGWQVQPGLPTVQGTLAEALERVIGETVLPQGSGRTDRGVHALGQVASFSLHAPIPPQNLQRALNRKLPPSVRVLGAHHVSPGFHARHSAVAKTYEYRVFRPELCPPFTAPYVYACPWPLALERMEAAARAVVGTHDFLSFAAHDPDLATRAGADPSSEAGPATVRTILASGWDEQGPLLIYRVTGTGFLHRMVRNLVGTFLDVGRGALEPDALGAILQARERRAAGPTAPARGLFLVSVAYNGADGEPEEGGGGVLTS